MQQSHCRFSARLPRLDFRNSLLIYDRRLEKSWGAWIRRFPFAYGVRSGEELKDLRAFPAHVEKILRRSEGLSPKTMSVVAFGGGSVGDFAGFFASVFKRGVRFVQVPSTWLAALDSAHGGKTALNAGAMKNQIGSFYPAAEVHLVREVLLELGPERFQEGRAEALKAALLDGDSLLRSLQRADSARKMWPLLPSLIRAKMKIVKRDPLEKKGIRHLLNLGHTLGHVIEAQSGVAHGRAVGLGTRFAIEWSIASGMARPELGQIAGLPSRQELGRVLRSLRNPEKFLLQDKKRSAGRKIRFIFLKAPGKPLIREVSLQEIQREIERQKA